ncbi:hypothetical protein Halru_2230 [Halovivax ruber XH-70]|uniref:Uncharacterized protein n=1 Tax=Halovivax ruber (strain DSM 18193 / JCM 13892 / XH-70) TaxID=797302 RepID=L0IF45_HALRX|nr:hypothetical protein [Halovivax ruber]AGB16816.1 hypothetical protein Halru_2230 [Halovivax ruber XH-70]
MARRLQLRDWDALVEELRRFGESGDVTADADSIRLNFGAGSVELERGGHVSTGMALHTFEYDGDASIVVDHDAGSLTIESGSVTYTFRRPGG